ncbi:hypothetical protein A2J03_08150 [Rhodococcus sp. EPR-157]|uniref:hypothetical protein n=1 Tax=Rhodococcus sp. EPR-157 TaxID=1813677 RepID=UPI0007BC6B0B|nr:hypothetical protein [Rhodococcus sp. EPR-157]KZF03228.1 hypothetical protein A2J03_08150 [Rhodococcus sp. EPR-157]
MNITQATAKVVATLEGSGLRVQGWAERKVVPPVAIVVPAQPFLDSEGDTTFEHPFVLHYLVQLVAGRGTGDTVQRALEDDITAAVLALTDVGMSVDDVQYPLIGTEDDSPTIGAQIEASVTINLKEDV